MRYYIRDLNSVLTIKADGMMLKLYSSMLEENIYSFLVSGLQSYQWDLSSLSRCKHWKCIRLLLTFYQFPDLKRLIIHSGQDVTLTRAYTCQSYQGSIVYRYLLDINGNWTLGCIGHPLQLSLRMSETTFAPAALDLDIHNFYLHKHSYHFKDGDKTFN